MAQKAKAAPTNARLILLHFTAGALTGYLVGTRPGHKTHRPLERPPRCHQVQDRHAQA